MGERQRHGFLYGTIVLAAGMAIVKLVGALFKIPLTNLLGGVGMSYFNVAYDLYYPLYALFISGVPVAVSKLVSESVARGRMRDARRLLRVSTTLFVGVGAVGAVLMAAGARWFTALVQNPDARYAIWMLAPALFFGCVMAALRGYFQGLQDMAPTAISQIVEALAKLVFGLGFAYLALLAGLRQFAREGTVFGIVCGTVEQARLAVLPFAAAGAILGVTASTLCGALYMIGRHKLGRAGISAESYRLSPPAAGAGVLAKRLLAVAVPVCVASVIANLTSFIDLISVMNRLGTAVSGSPQVLLTLYQGAIPAGVGLERLPSYLYGCYSGLAVPIYNLVPALATTISVSLLPAVTAAWATHDNAALTRNVSSALRLTSLVAMPAGLGICALAAPILRMLYFSRPMEVAVIARMLPLMGISAIFVALSLPVSAILQATGRADLPVKLLLLGGVVKLTLNYLLVAIPRLNIQAVPVGTLACYAFVLFAGMAALLQSTGLQLPFLAIFGKPLFASCCCGAAAFVTYNGLASIWSGSVVTLCAIASGVIVYAVVILMTKTITKVDIFMLPGGEKFAQLLEKHSFLG